MDRGQYQHDVFGGETGENHEEPYWDDSRHQSSTATDKQTPSSAGTTSTEKDIRTVVYDNENSSVWTRPKTIESDYDSTACRLEEADSANGNAACRGSQAVPQNDEEDGDEYLKLSIDDAMEQLGMGRFQFLILLAAGLCFAADSMEVLLLSFLAVVLQAQWELSDRDTAWITSSVFLGATTGTIVSGYLGDRWGRKPVLCLTAFLIFFFGFTTGLATDLPSLLFYRFMVGLGVGGSTVPFDILAEFVPNTHRGRDLLVIEYFWTGGSLLVSVVAILTLGQSDNQEDHHNEWRSFVIILAIPCLISFLVAVVFVPESPRWLLTKGKHDEALEVLQAAATRNGKNPLEIFPPGTIILKEEEESHNLCTLFRPEWRWTTIMVWCKGLLVLLSFCRAFARRSPQRFLVSRIVVWGGFAVTYFGTIITVTMIFAANPDELETDGAYSFDYAAILASASAEFAGTTITILLVDRLGRIPTLVASYLGGGFSVFLLTLLAMDSDSPREQLILMGFLSRLFFMGGSCTTWVSTAEIMPTEIRTTGHSWSNAFARLAGAASPYLITEHRPYIFSGVVIMIISLATALASSRLPETKGQFMGMRGDNTKKADTGLDVLRRPLSYTTIT